MNIPFPVEIHVTKKDDNRYTGHIGIINAKLDYKLISKIPISEITRPYTGKKQRVFEIKMKQGGKEIRLTPEEYVFFYSILALPARRFHEKIHEKETKGKCVILLYALELTPEIKEVFSAKKFGVNLPF